jgi:hypothetical protein
MKISRPLFTIIFKSKMKMSKLWSTYIPLRMNSSCCDLKRESKYAKLTDSRSTFWGSSMVCFAVMMVRKQKRQNKKYTTGRNWSLCISVVRWAIFYGTEFEIWIGFELATSMYWRISAILLLRVHFSCFHGHMSLSLDT